MKKLFRSPYTCATGTETIGIIPVKSNAYDMCIHTAIAIANYLTGVARKKGAIVALSDSGFMHSLYKYYTDSKCHMEETYFELFGVRYYFRYSEKIFSELMSENPDYIIFIGENTFIGNCPAFKSCHRKIVAGRLTPWDTKAYTDFLRRMSLLYSGKPGDCCRCWNYVAQYFSDTDKKSIEKKYNISIQRLPFDLNPFKIKQTEFQFFESIFNK